MKTLFKNMYFHYLLIRFTNLNRILSFFLLIYYIYYLMIAYVLYVPMNGLVPDIWRFIHFSNNKNDDSNQDLT